MGLSSLASRSLSPPTGPPARGHPAARAPAYHGHAHFWQRALSRRRLVQTAAGASALAVGGGLRLPRLAGATQMEGAMPKPIPGGIDPFGDGTIFHIYLPGPGVDPSVITDFRGLVGVHHVQGEGTVTTGGGGGGMSTPTATGDRLVFDADMRFMQGLYLGEDGQEHQGTFALI